MAEAANKFDLAVIGGGPGGYVAAIRAAQLGMQVALVEKDKVGGVCLNVGCIPTKALLRNAEVVSLCRRAKEFGISFDNLRCDFSEAVKRSRRVAQRLSKGVEYLLKKHRVNLIRGEARLVAAGRVEVRDGEGKVQETVESARVLLATGSRPKAMAGLIPDGRRILTSNEALFLDQAPKSLIVLGAGAVGVELADIFHAYGTEVTVVEMLPQILPVEDAEVSELLSKVLSKKGIRILTGAEVTSAAPELDGVRVAVSAAGQAKELGAEMVLVAIGRAPNSEGLGAEELGVAVERGFVRVNERMETSVAGIFAVGDLIGPPLLAHTAMAEGVAAVEVMAGMKLRPLDYRSMPACTYCHPQVASIGLTESKARDEGYEIKVGRFPFQANGKAQAIAEPEGLVKIISDADSGEILGVHILGAEATEMIAALGLARTLEATPEEIAHTVHAHPTMSEAVMEAALAALGQAIHI